jgi:hypothetical protein
MKRRIQSLLLLLLALPLVAQAVDEAAERARIAAERKQADERFAADEKACWRRFAVNDCIAEAKGRQRATLGGLRRQEIHLNDIERKRRAAERQGQIDERQSPENQEREAQQRAQASQEQQQREARAAEKVVRRRQKEAEAQAAAEAAQRPKQPRSGPTIPASEAAANRRDFEKRLADAHERKVKAAQRQAERKKPPAQPLPVPP